MTVSMTLTSCLTLDSAAFPGARREVHLPFLLSFTTCPLPAAEDQVENTASGSRGFDVWWVPLSEPRLLHSPVE